MTIFMTILSLIAFVINAYLAFAFFAAKQNVLAIMYAIATVAWLAGFVSWLKLAIR